jgi:transcriptional regulator with XRE-family HTH domain
MKLRGKQVTAARDLLGITQAELAEAAGVSRLTVFGFESGQTEPRRENLQKIQAELERRGIEFSNSDGMGVRLIFAKAAEAARGSQDGAP